MCIRDSDPSGVPQIAYLFNTTAGSTFNFYARQNGTASAPWGVLEGIGTSSSSDPIDWMSFAANAKTTAAAYMDGAGNLYYATRTVGWHSQLVDTWGLPCCITNPYTENPVSLALNAAGYPRIAYGAISGNNDGTNVAFFDGSSWAFLPLNQVPSTAEPLDYLNRVAIASDQADAEHVLFLKGLGTAVPELIYDRVSGVNTPPGSDVTVSLPDTGKYGAPITVNFAQVTTAG